MRTAGVLSAVAVVMASGLAMGCSSSSTNPRDQPDSGPADGGGGADAGSSFCASLSPAPRFCDDFDRPGPPGYGWNGLVAEKGGSVTLDTQFAASPPQSALVQTSGDGGDCAYADLQKRFEAPPASTLRLAFSLRAGAGDVAIVAVLYFEGPNGTSPCHALLYALGDQGHIVLSTADTDAGGGTTFAEPSFSYFAVTGGAWSRYEILIAPGDGGVPTATAVVDGHAAIDPVAMPQCELGGTGSVILGLFCSDPPGRELSLDNVVIDDK